MARKAQIIPPKPDLKRKAVNFTKGYDLKITPEVMTKLEKVVNKSRDKFTKDIAGRLAHMRASMDDMAGNPDQHPHLIARVAHASLEIKGAGGTIGFDLLTRIGKSLNDFVTGLTSLQSTQIAIITLHIDAMHAVLANHVTGAGGEVEAALVNTFDEARAKFKDAS